MNATTTKAERRGRIGSWRQDGTSVPSCQEGGSEAEDTVVFARTEHEAERLFGRRKLWERVRRTVGPFRLTSCDGQLRGPRRVALAAIIATWERAASECRTAEDEDAVSTCAVAALERFATEAATVAQCANAMRYWRRRRADARARASTATRRALVYYLDERAVVIGAGVQ